MPFRRLLLVASLVLALPSPAGAADPGGWHRAAPLPAPLTGATATTLPGGDVLVAGGAPGDGRAAFLYDPAADGWTRVGDLEQGRSGHTATLVDGRVLAAGGIAPGGGYVSQAERYDPKTQKWSPAGVLRTPRAHHTATLTHNHLVLVAGGDAQDPAYPTTTEIYDPVKNGWRPGPPLDRGRDDAAAALAGDGTVLLAGGDAGDDPFGDSVLSPPDIGAWSKPVRTTAARTQATATSLPDGSVLLAGGTADGRTGLATAETFAGGNWSGTGPMTAGRLGQTATALPDGDVLLAGGLDRGEPLASSEVFDPAARKFAAAGDMAVRRAGHVAALLDDGSVLVAGGEAGDKPLDDVERWTPPAAGLPDVGVTLESPAPAATGGPGVTLTPTAAVIDRDRDGVADARDNCPEAANATQADRDADGIGDACDTALPPGNAPVVAGRTARVQLVSGEVFVKLPAGARAAAAGDAPAGFVPLKGAATVPIGSTVDARAGTLALTTAAAFRGPATQRARLSAAMFQVRQARARKGLARKGVPRPFADLVLRTPAGAANACAHGPVKGAVRTLSGAGAGFFRTVGAASTAVVKGNATWTVQDRCEGTLTMVGRGRVTVLAHRAHRAQVVRAGQAYLVGARLFAMRRR